MSVVVTGLGTVGAFGAGRLALSGALAEGRARPVEVDRSAGYHRPGASRLALLVAGLDLSAWVPAAAARRMSALSKMAIAASRLALEDSGLTGESQAPPPVTAVVMATSWGSTLFTERILRQIQLESPESVSPFLFTECVANAAPAQVAIALGARGANITVTQREAGTLMALSQGAGEITNGRAGRVLAGCVDEMTPTLHAILGRFGSLARADESVARPLDRDRDGFLAAEGATVFVLEDEASARRRGAPIRARLRFALRGFDPTAGVTSWGRGEERLGARLASAIRSAGIAPESIGAIVSGASGSPGADRLEAATLSAAWRHLEAGPLPPVLVPKSVTGEYAGFSAGAALIALEERSFGPPSGFRVADPALGVVPHPGGPLPDRPVVLVSALACGGAAAWIALERGEA